MLYVDPDVEILKTVEEKCQKDVEQKELLHPALKNFFEVYRSKLPKALIHKKGR